MLHKPKASEIFTISHADESNNLLIPYLIYAYACSVDGDITPQNMGSQFTLRVIQNCTVSI